MTGDEDGKQPSEVELKASLLGGGASGDAPFRSRVVRIGNPKIYKMPWGVSRRFFVEFENGQKAMFSAGHEGRFSRGDTIEITNPKIDGEWLSVSDGASLSIMQSKCIDDCITISAEIGYVTKPKQDGAKTYYKCYNFQITKSPGMDFDQFNSIKMIHFPLEVVWQDKGVSSPPAYSSVSLLGSIVGDTFFVKEILGELPIQRIETIVVKVSELKFHRWGADFQFKFGTETFIGTIATPFFSSPAYNVIRKDWEGSVEISGVWFKRGHVVKENGGWKDEIFWQLAKGKNKWDTFAVKGIQESVRLYQSVEGFADFMDKITQSSDIISYDAASNQFKELGFDVSPSEVRLFLWHQDLEESYINYLMRISDETYQTTNDEFFFYFRPNEQRKKGVIICEVPKEQYSTIIIQEKDDWKEQIGKLLHISRDAVIRTPALWDEIGIKKTIRHDADWETLVMVSVLEVGQ